MAEHGTGVVGFMPVAVAAPSIRYRTMSFAPGLLRLSGRPSNPHPFERTLNHRIVPGSDIRTKTGVVRLRQRKGPERDGKRPKMGFAAGVRGSEKWPRSPAFCEVPAGAERWEQNVPDG
jgi:hypothetical protein